MSTGPKFCAHGGVIGGTRTYRPTDAWERGWGHPRAAVLCANLICRCCSTRIRSIANHRLPAAPEGGGDKPAMPRWRPIDFAGRRIDLVRALKLVVDERARTFACACRAVTAWDAHPVSAQVVTADGAAPLPWTCAGHPSLASGDALDGETLPTDAGGWLVLAQRALRGEWPTAHRGRDVHDAIHPGFRLAHVLVHMTDTKLQMALGRRIGAWGLTSDDPVVRRATLDVYHILPRFFGFEALGDALTKHRVLYDEATYTDENGQPVSLGVLLRNTVDRNLIMGPVEPLSSAVRMDMLAGFGCTAFIRTIVRDTPTWAIERLTRVVGHDVRSRAVLLASMRELHPSLVQDLERALPPG